MNRMVDRSVVGSDHLTLKGYVALEGLVGKELRHASRPSLCTEYTKSCINTGLMVISLERAATQSHRILSALLLVLPADCDRDCICICDREHLLISTRARTSPIQGSNERKP